MKRIDIIVPCFNPNKEIIKTIESLLFQNINDNWVLSIVVINDASTETKYVSKIHANFKQVNIINLDENKGRSGACDFGAKSSDAEIIVFLDADCVYEDEQMIEQHRQSICQGNDANFGRIDVKCENKIFWDDYFKTISKKRDTQATNKNFMELTSANLAISRDCYFEVGGFDSDYKHYGFEDRDLIYKLISANKKLKYSPQNIAYHKAFLSLVSICKKMMIAGRYTSGVFFNKHPQAYRNMPYSKVDACLKPLIKIPINTIWVLFNRSVGLGDTLLNKSFIPFRIKRYIVLAFSALYFSKGTLERCKTK